MFKNNFPLIFGRKGGGEFSMLGSLRTPSIENYIVTLLIQQNEITVLINRLIADLHVVISKEDDIKTKHQLLNFKRDLFNNRPIEKHLTLIKTHIILEENFNQYYQRTDTYNKAKQEYKEVFYKDFYASIENLKGLSENYFLKNGLLFSSNILSKEIKKSDFRFTSLNKKNRRLLISTLKYLTRSLTKTTPFSSFNSIFCLENREGQYRPIYLAVKTSNFQITNLFFYYLKELILKDQDFKNCLDIYCNTTLWEYQKQDNVFHFFINKKNNEAFKKLSKSPILLYIKDQLSSNELNYSALIDKIKRVTEDKKDTIISFVDTLINEGVLQITYPVSSDDKNWIQRLLDFINRNESQLTKKFKDLISVLKNIQSTIEALENIFEVEERQQLILNSHIEIITFLRSWNDDTAFTRKVAPQDLFYEDTFSKTSDLISLKTLNTTSSSLKRVFLNLNNIPYKKTLKQFFAKYLKEEYNRKLPILLFYEKIYLKHINEFTLTDSDLSIFRREFKKIVHLINENTSGPTNPIDVSNYTKKTKDENEDSISFGCYIQVANNNWDQLILNNFSNGNGSNISRFLNFLPDEFANKVLEFNKNNYQGKIITEVKDASIHNVNTYPPLSEYVISVNEDFSLKESYTSISLSEIYVVYDLDEGLLLKNEKGVEIQPNSFSLEGLNRKSKFTQFLDIFNPVDTSGYILFKQSIWQLYVNKLRHKDIVHIPRIVYGKTIIIQREKWLVKKEFMLKSLDKTKQALDKNFMIINQWILQNKIPDEVFIKIAQRDLSNSQNDNYKPQYINFKSPVFLLLFINMVNKADDIIEITEMYPNASHIDQTGGYAKEYVLNIN